MAVVPVDDLCRAVVDALSAAGASPVAARTSAEAIVYAETSGVQSHGLSRVKPLVEQLKSGKINGAATFTAVESGPALRLVDANFGLGYAAAACATDSVVRGLKTSPVVVAAVSRSHHFGMAGRYSELIAEAGYVAFVCSSTFGAVAPVGGHRSLLGNPPLSVAAPRADAPPVVIDLAPAVVARGNIAAAAARGDAIPAGWARDEQGLPTTDAAAAMRGTLQTIGGDKGVVLAMLVDVLVAALTVSCLPGEASSVFTPEGPPPQLGHLLVGFDPAEFGVDATARVSSYVDSLTGDGMRVPGERRRKNRQAAAVHGVAVDDLLWQELLNRLSQI
jgi:(2R)-3-sulfolactate dehydrogenase (NADP+)